MKYLLTVLFAITIIKSTAQKNFVRYYDSTDTRTAKDNAAYYTEFVKDDSVYIATSYYLPSNKIQGKATYAIADTISLRAKGIKLKYHENGNLKDSALFTHKGKKVYGFTFYESGKLEDSSTYGKDWNESDTYSFNEKGKLIGHTYYDKATKKEISLGYDENGNIIPDYVYRKPPSYPGGIQFWLKYLERNLNASKPSDNGAKDGKYTVIVSFLVDTQGNVSDVIAENNPGYGTMEEALRVIKKGGRWEPAIKNNKPISFRHRQSITFMVSSN